jgi:hypothetical protein
MRRVDGLILIFISFYVSVLTPRLNSTDISLQLPVAYIQMSSANRPRETPGVSGLSFIHTYIVQYGGQDRILWHARLYIPRSRNFTFDQDSEISLREKRATKLDNTD